MKRCAAYISARAYSSPGPCENKVDVLPIIYQRGRESINIKACALHRRMIKHGRKINLTKDMPLDERRKHLLLLARYRGMVIG